MTPEEFKYKFKVGDLIYTDGIICREITAIGKNTFLGYCFITNKEENLPINRDWKKDDSEKKPSEEINEKVSEELNYAPELRNFTSELITELKCRHILQWLDENWPKVVKKEL